MLEKVVPKTSDRLQEAVKNFIRTKRAFNDYEPKAAGYLDWVSSLNPHAFIDQYESGYACSPALTLRNVLPFFESHPTGDVTRRPASVPVALVMGSSWRWAEHLIPNSTRSAEEWETYLTADKRVQHDTASVTFVRQLGLFFVSGEGKNRVAFLARRNVEFMPCVLAEVDYPEANRLQVFELFEGSFRTWLCVLDEEFVCTIPYPELTLPILEAYGVPRSKKWPFTEVVPSTVLSCLRKQRGDPSLLGMRSDTVSTPLEMTYLAELEHLVGEAIDREWHPAGMHARVEFDWRRWAIGLGGLATLASVAGVFSAPQSLAAVGAGALLTWLLCPLFIQIRPGCAQLPDSVVAALAAEKLSERFRVLPVRKPSGAATAVVAGHQAQA